MRSAVEAAKVERRRSLEQLEIARVQALREAEIESREDIERARIASERGLDEVRISHEAERRRLEVEREKLVETAQMDKAITLYRKSLEESAARLDADTARANAAAAEERIATARETEVANRRKAIDVLLAEKTAAERTIAAGAEKVRLTIEAEAQRLLNEAENVLTDPARVSLFRRKLLEHVEGIVAASVKPLEKIQDIRIMQLDGMGGGGGEGRSGSPTDEVINSALRYRVQAPLIDSLLADIGIDGANLAKQGGLIREASDMQRIASEAKQASAAAMAASQAHRSRAAEVEGALNAPHLYVLRHRCSGCESVGEGARLQRAAALASAYPGKPDRERRAVGQDRLRARFPTAEWRSPAREAARPFRLRHVLHVCDPRIADAAYRLHGDATADSRSATAIGHSSSGRPNSTVRPRQRPISSTASRTMSSRRGLTR